MNTKEQLDFLVGLEIAQFSQKMGKRNRQRMRSKLRQWRSNYVFGVNMGPDFAEKINKLYLEAVVRRIT